MPHSVEKEFTFSFGSKEGRSTLTVPVTIPLESSPAELVGRLQKMHNLPCNVIDELTGKMEEFSARETSRLHDQNAEESIQRLHQGKADSKTLLDRWTQAYSKEVKEYATVVEEDPLQTFANVYHTLIHSPALETLLNLEHTYALAMENIIDRRDKDLKHLEGKHQQEMEQALQHVGEAYGDDDINTLAQRHFDNMQLIEGKWAGELSQLREEQKREYHNWVHRVYEDTQAASTPSYVHRLRTASASLPVAEDAERQVQNRLEESFTIHLGAQMKTTHNLRLLCTHVLDLCRHKPHTVGGMVVPQPQRLQTAMSLYSNSLCGMILLVDNRLNSYTGIKRDFAAVCEQSTDFHFPDVGRQMLAMEQAFGQANAVRAARQLQQQQEGDSVSVHSTGSGNSATSDHQDRTLGARLHTGDFYLTKHSNLSEVHLVFHLVVDENVRTGDITSRHPAILSIRNIIRLCFRYDIQTLTIPLLLTHEMTEEMTIPWCLKRAELLFKCVKGFMIEMATYSSQVSRTIQFLVPRGLSEEMFAQISNMVPGIFRLSNTLVVKTA
ncbi:FERRY endosomal RAB5 effector complex subunit 3-like [Babylonia areolata]|uniref:FERRY endosomal RAB5 effector complex subunit 3-like n=1 Tax=Babylonia areolata TaxID=304850 RepID=UPI003FD42959